MIEIKVYGPQGQASFSNDNATELWQAIDEEVVTNDFIGYGDMSEERKLEWQQDLDDTKGVESFLEDAKKRGFIESYEID